MTRNPFNAMSDIEADTVTIELSRKTAEFWSQMPSADRDARIDEIVKGCQTALRGSDEQAV